MRAWLLAIRPRTLVVGAVPVVVGTAAAHGNGAAQWLPALAALLGALLIQIGTNLTNDYYDYRKGVDRADRLGATRASASGLLRPAFVRDAGLVSYGLAGAAGLYLASVGGWPILAIGVASIVVGMLYTAGPFPLGYVGLGDPLAFLFFGPVAVAGTFYVQVQVWSPIATMAGVSLGCLAAAVLVVNNLRDRDTDARAGKRTLAVLAGERASRAEYVTLLALAYVGLAPIVLGAGAGPWTLLPLATLPFAFLAARAMTKARDGATFNRLLASTARLSGLFGLALALGLVL